jgi:hypothetical protein
MHGPFVRRLNLAKFLLTLSHRNDRAVVANVRAYVIVQVAEVAVPRELSRCQWTSIQKVQAFRVAGALLRVTTSVVCLTRKKDQVSGSNDGKTTGPARNGARGYEEADPARCYRRRSRVHSASSSDQCRLHPVDTRMSNARPRGDSIAVKPSEAGAGSPREILVVCGRYV